MALDYSIGQLTGAFPSSAWPVFSWPDGAWPIVALIASTGSGEGGESESVGNSMANIILSPNSFIDLRPLGPNGSFLMADNNYPAGVRWVELTQSNIAEDLTISNFKVYPSAVIAGLPQPFFPYFEFDSNQTLTDAYIQDDLIFISPTTLQSPYTSGYYDYDFANLPPGIVINFSLVATNTSGTASAQTSLIVGQKVYWGTGTDTGAYNSGFINSLGNYVLSTGVNLDISINVPSGQYAWVAHRSAISDPKFKDKSNDIVGGFSLVATGVSYSNGSGYTENYKLWRSHYSGLGVLSLNVN